MCDCLLTTDTVKFGMIQYLNWRRWQLVLHYHLRPSVNQGAVPWLSVGDSINLRANLLRVSGGVPRYHSCQWQNGDPFWWHHSAHETLFSHQPTL